MVPITSISLYELCGARPSVRLSPHCWKVRMALAHKGLDATFIPWRFTEKEAIAFTGQSLVPVLLHEGRSVHDSWAIAQYLEAQFPTCPALFGGEQVESLSRFINAWTDVVLIPAVAKVILMDIYRMIDDRDKEYFRRTREKRFGMTLEAVVADGESRLSDLRRSLEPLRTHLRASRFIGGCSPTYADYSVFGVFMWARVCSNVAILDETDTLLAAWRDRLLDAFGGMARSAPIAGDG